jgi:hypothetical protein
VTKLNFIRYFVNCPLCNRELIFEDNAFSGEIWRCPLIYTYKNDYYHFILSKSGFSVCKNKLQLLYTNHTEILNITNLDTLTTIFKIKTDINTVYDICKIEDNLLDKLKLYQTFS